jgi:hypothetical protein
MNKKVLMLAFLSMACVVSFSGNSLFAKTPGEKLDDTIEKTNYKYDHAKDKVEEKCDEAKHRAEENYKKAKDEVKYEKNKAKDKLREKLK